MSAEDKVAAAWAKAKAESEEAKKAKWHERRLRGSQGKPEPTLTHSLTHLGHTHIVACNVAGYRSWYYADTGAFQENVQCNGHEHSPDPVFILILVLHPACRVCPCTGCHGRQPGSVPAAASA